MAKKKVIDVPDLTDGLIGATQADVSGRSPEQGAVGIAGTVGEASVAQGDPGEKNKMEHAPTPQSAYDVAWIVDDIPDEELPPWSNQFGVKTPGLEDWCKANKMSEEQIVALVNRLTSMKRR